MALGPQQSVRLLRAMVSDLELAVSSDQVEAATMAGHLALVAALLADSIERSYGHPDGG